MSLCSLIYINRNHSIVDFNGLDNIKHCVALLSPGKVLEKLILDDCVQNNGFLIWYLNCCLGCVIHHYVLDKKQKTKYFLLHVLKQMN